MNRKGVLLAFATVFFFSIGFVSSTHIFEAMCGYQPGDCYLGSSGGPNFGDESYVMGTFPDCDTVVERCSVDNKHVIDIFSDVMNDPPLNGPCATLDGHGNSGMYCCYDYLPATTEIIEDCSLTSGICIDDAGSVSCCVPWTCTDAYSAGLCGLNIDDTCTGVISCTGIGPDPPLPTNTVCNDPTLGCIVDYDNCNGDWATDECEVNLLNDPLNCGTCSSVCSSGVCNNGVCADANEWHDDMGSKIVSALVGETVYFYSTESPGGPFRIFEGPNEIEASYSGPSYVFLVPNTGYQFEVVSGVEPPSDLLNVKATTGEPFDTKILGPPCATAHNVGSDISVIIDSLTGDPIDTITFSFYYDGIRDSDSDITISSIGSDSYTYDYTTVVPGNLQIRASTTSYSGVTVNDVSNFIVYDSFDTGTATYIASCINFPSHYVGSTEVVFDATDSRALTYTGSGSSSGGNFVWADASQLYYQWTFSYANGQTAECEGHGYQTCPGTIDPISLFTKVFPSAGPNSVSLTVSV